MQASGTKVLLTYSEGNKRALLRRTRPKEDDSKRDTGSDGKENRNAQEKLPVSQCCHSAEFECEVGDRGDEDQAPGGSGVDMLLIDHVAK